MSSSVVFADRVGRYFDLVHREVFEGDPASNARLKVEVLGAEMAHDTPTVILVAPWTLCGLAQPPDGRLPATLRVGSRLYPALANEVEEIGNYWSAVLVPDVSGYRSQEEAVAAGQRLVEPFRLAVEKARQTLTEVEDVDRRSLLNTVAGKAEPASETETAFGSPNGSSSQTPGD